MGRAPPVCYTSEDLVHCVGRMMIVGPAGYVERSRPEDYIDLGEWARQRGFTDA